jgi:hypothetical protein
MTAIAKKAPKKEKVKKQSPEERLEALRYNQMMYGPTAGERKPALKKVDYGASYLKHPKFQSLMTAFKHGTAYKFEVSDKGKVFAISTEESQILFDGRIIYYSRSVNRHEQDLLMDRATLIQFQTNEALIHLAFAVIRSFPELGPLQLAYLNNQFYYGAESFEAGIAAQGPNFLVGSFKRVSAPDKKRT